MSIGSRNEVGREVKILARVTLVFFLSFYAFAAAHSQDQQAPASNAPSPDMNPPSQAPLASPPQAEGQGPAPLRVMVGKSLLVNVNGRLSRVAVTDPTVADYVVIGPSQILVNGLAAGEVSLLIWDELGRSRSFDLRVDVDVTAAAEEMQRLFPQERITVRPSRSAIVLSGHVSTEDTADRAGKIAQAFSKNVVNVLTFGPVGSQEVLLEVKFAEVDRAALTQLGVNILSTGAGNTIGTIGTQQFGGFSQQQITDRFGVPTSPAPTSPTAVTGPSTTAFSSNETIGDVLNLFLFKPDIHLGAVIKALQTRNLLQILAEPTLIAVNGKEASFLAGGEFPFPVVQPGQGFTAVTIQFKEFGVKLKFTPVIMPNGYIHLKVVPEVSTLDFANALTIQGFTIPAFSTRRADTEFELQDGQSFVIAGLMDNRVTSLTSKIPGLGDIPIIGNLFKSKSLSKSNAELMVLCTVRLVSPSTTAPAGPKNPKPFLDQDQFDGTKAPGGTK